MHYVGVWTEEWKQHLPDSPVIPMVTYFKGEKPGVQENHSDLIAVQHLRGERLFVQREENRVPRGFLDDPESINVPSAFIKKDSYLALLIPNYHRDDIGDKSVKSYDITVLKCVNDHELLKMQSVNELTFRSLWNEIRKDRGKLVLPEMLYDHFPELTKIRVNEGQESVNIWIGDQPTKWFFDAEGKTVVGKDESYYKRTVNGTICYRLVKGKAERKKSQDRPRYLKLVPQITGSI